MGHTVLQTEGVIGRLAISTAGSLGFSEGLSVSFPYFLRLPVVFLGIFCKDDED